MKKEKRIWHGEEINVIVHELEDCNKGHHCDGCEIEFAHKDEIPNASIACCVCKKSFKE